MEMNQKIMGNYSMEKKIKMKTQNSLRKRLESGIGGMEKQVSSSGQLEQEMLELLRQCRLYNRMRLKELSAWNL